MPPDDPTPLGDAMTHRFPEQKFPERQPDADEQAADAGTLGADPEVPAPESVPPIPNPDPRPGDPKPTIPPPEDEPGRHPVPIELPGQPHAPERA